MTQISRYLLRNLIAATLAVTAALTFAIWLVLSLRQIERVLEGGAPLAFFLKLAVLSFPSILSIILPIALMAAVLFTYNRLTLDSELVVMRAAGLGPLMLARPAFFLAGCVTVLCFLLSLWLAPAAERGLVATFQKITNEFSAVLIREGAYNDFGDGLTVYVRQRDEKGELNGLLIQDARHPERPITIIADRGVLVTAEAGPRVVVFNGTQLEFHPETGEVDTLDFSRYTVDLNVLQADNAGRWPDPRERPTYELVFHTSDPRDAAFSTRLTAELHKRLAMPLFALGFTMVALAALLSGEFTRRGQARRVLAAALLAVTLESVVLGISDLAAKNLALTPLLYAIVASPVLFGWWYLTRWRQVRRLIARALPAA